MATAAILDAPSRHSPGHLRSEMSPCRRAQATGSFLLLLFVFFCFSLLLLLLPVMAAATGKVLLLAAALAVCGRVPGAAATPALQWMTFYGFNITAQVCDLCAEQNT